MIIKHTEEFDLAYRFVTETSLNIFITGNAGTGKTTFLKYLQRNSTKNIVVAAPTGVAAINAKGVTLHSLFQLPFGIIIPDSQPGQTIDGMTKNPFLLSKIHYTKEKLNLLNSIELLIIDEVSMLASYILDAIDAILRNVRRNEHQPFGGVQILFIGDLYQLPPVVKREDWEILKEYYSSIFFFDSIILRNNIPIIIEFKEIFRQKDDKFIEILNGIRNNNITDENFDLLNSRIKRNYIPRDAEGCIILTTHNFQSDEINKRKLSNLPGRRYVFESEISGEFPENSLPAEKELILKCGAQVMFLKNDTEGKQYFNGKIGIITMLDQETIKVKCKDDPFEIEVKKYEWQNIRYKLNAETREITEEILGSFMQYPLRLAWAITIHKSQGLTFDKVIVDAEKAFTTGQVYVALSRCTSLDGLILNSPIHTNYLGAHKDLTAWNNPQEKDILRLFEKAREDYILKELLEIFTWRSLYNHLKELNEFLIENQEKISSEALLWTSNLIEKEKELYRIGEKFKIEISKLRGQNSSIEGNDFLQKRIKAGADYFCNEMNKYSELILEHPISVETKKISRKIDPLLEELTNNLNETLQKINFCKNGFHLDQYLKSKKFFILSSRQIKSSYSKIKVKTAGYTITETLKLIKGGRNIGEIALGRNLSGGTIENHLAKAIKENLIQLEEVMDVEEAKKISMYFPKDLNDIRLAAIKEAAPPEITYGKLRIVLAWLQKGKKG